MRNKQYLTLSLLILFLFAFSSIYGQDDAAGEKTASEASGFTAEFVGQIHFIQGRLLELQKAVPQENYNWRPAEGIRSVGEVYLHAALANYYFIKMSGQQLPQDINIDIGPEKWDKMTSDKQEITKILKRSFADIQKTAQNISDADLAKTVKVFGMEMSMRNFMVSSLNHLHEHLGQSIAYARINGVTPPWTAKAQAQATQKEKESR
jgi:uncharacterized damage-inducible protein DinB